MMLILKIFLGKLIDVTLSTLTTVYIIKNKKLTAAIAGFFDVLIWFIVVKEAITTDNPSFMIPLSYALGYGAGTLLGLLISNYFMKSVSTVLIITNDKKITKVIADKNYGGTVLNTKGLKDNKDNYTIISQVDSRKLKNFKKMINEYDKTAMVVTIDSKNVLNAYL